MKIEKAHITLPSTSIVASGRKGRRKYRRKVARERCCHWLIICLVVCIGGSHFGWKIYLQHYTSIEILEQARVNEVVSLSPYFVQWGHERDDALGEEEGIDLEEMLKFLNDTAGIPGPSYGSHSPDSLYLLSKDPKTNEIKWEISMNSYWKHPVSFRRRELTYGLDYVQATLETRYAENPSAWPRIQEALEEQGGVGFPFLINWDSSRNCTHTCCDELYEMDPSQQIQTNGHIPVMRLVGPVDCQYHLFIPTAPTLLMSSKDNDDSWDTKLQENEKNYPRENHIQKVAWYDDNPEIVATLKNFSDMVEVIPTVVNQEFLLEDYQKYAAILDIDTIHYPQLFCQNSVVLKTTPKCKDMFLSTLRPWEHYVPVRSDLSDLSIRIEYVLSNEHREQVRGIVQNATEWCKDQFVYTKLQDHLLTTLTYQLEKMDEHDRDWPKKWERLRSVYLQGHFFLTRPEAWSLPKSTVGAIKTGMRKDDPRYNATTKLVERRLMKSIMKNWGEKKIKEEEEKELKRLERQK